MTVAIAPLAADGRPRLGEAVVLDVDAVLTGEGFCPSSELPRPLGCQSNRDGIDRKDDGSTSLANVFVVGEAGGFGDAHIALAQGELAGREAARRLGARVFPG